MYYRLKYGKYYLIKVIILVLVAVLGELFIWWALVRDESVDWITGQLVHNPSVYAITQMDDGRTIVGNVLDGFEITLPTGWKATQGKAPDFYFDINGQGICEIKSRVNRSAEETAISELLKEQTGFSRIYAGIAPAIKKEEILENGKFIYEIQIPVDGVVVNYIMSSEKKDKNQCRPDFEQVRKSFLYY
jgi:hypothetical protein